MTTSVVALAISVLIGVENNGSLHHNPKGVNDGGRAAGPLQMWKISVDEANRLVGKKQWSYCDRLDYRKSYDMAKVLLGAQLKRKRPPTNLEELCSRWRNPNGDAPEWYKAKVRRWTQIVQSRHL